MVVSGSEPIDGIDSTGSSLLTRSGATVGSLLPMSKPAALIASGFITLLATNSLSASFSSFE